jgi:hypothetical protein
MPERWDSPRAETAIRSKMCNAVEVDVGNGRAFADDPITSLQMILEQFQRDLAFCGVHFHRRRV